MYNIAFVEILVGTNALNGGNPSGDECPECLQRGYL
jgi:hypothetical protein